jgi:hypothetical protein
MTCSVAVAVVVVAAAVVVAVVVAPVEPSHTDPLVPGVVAAVDC